MSDFKKLSHDLVERLALPYEPVGVSLYKTGESLPAQIPFTSENLKSYCQALVLAGEGSTFLLKKDQMECKLETSVLGFEKDRAFYLDDGVLEKCGVGLFETEEISAETILRSTYLEKGKTEAALIAPLFSFQEKPRVMVFTAGSEQIMWLLYAVNYERGGVWRCFSPEWH